MVCLLSLLSGKGGEPVYSSAQGGSRTTSPAALPRLRANLNPLTVRARHQWRRGCSSSSGSAVGLLARRSEALSCSCG